MKQRGHVSQVGDPDLNDFNRQPWRQHLEPAVPPLGQSPRSQVTTETMSTIQGRPERAAYLACSEDQCWLFFHKRPVCSQWHLSETHDFPGSYLTSPVGTLSVSRIPAHSKALFTWRSHGEGKPQRATAMGRLHGTSSSLTLDNGNTHFLPGPPFLPLL